MWDYCSVPADTQDFFDDDLDDLLDDDVIQFQNFTSDEEYLILDAPGDYSIVTRYEQKPPPYTSIVARRWNLLQRQLQRVVVLQL